jgi:hypothetical protein
MTTTHDTTPSPDSEKVTVRSTGGIYLARCGRKNASCTMDAVSAAARAAGKHFGVLDTKIHLLEVGGAGPLTTFRALPCAALGYATASELAEAHRVAMYGRRA